MLNLSVLLEDSARKYPLRPSFTYADITFTFAQINQEANRIANGLVSIGVKPGDKVAMTCPNVPHFPVLYYGILKAGAVVVPLNILFKKEEIIYHLKDSDAKTYLCYTGSEDLPMGKYGWDAFNLVPGCEHFFMVMPKPAMAASIFKAETLDDLIAGQPTAFEAVQTNADDTAIIIYTSGTTGAAKGAELTHSNLFTNAVVATNVLQSTKNDIQLVVLPLFHIFGMTVLMNAGLYNGVHSILLSRFEPVTVFKLIRQYNVSIFAAVPAMYHVLLNCTVDAIYETAIKEKLRICISGGASLPVKIIEEFESRFDVPIIEGYRMSEGSPIVTFNQLEVGCKPGSIGTPVWGVEVKVVNAEDEEVAIGEKGELLYRGPNVMKGYYKKPEATTETIKNGWLYSGDVAVKDEDGFFYIVDRIKDMIIRCGNNVYPREVEEVMMKHESISSVAIVGVPSEKQGEEIKAFVVLKKEANSTVEEIIQWTKERIALYKYPRFVEIVEALPLNASGKILKKELRNK